MAVALIHYVSSLPSHHYIIMCIFLIPVLTRQLEWASRAWLFFNLIRLTSTQPQCINCMSITLFPSSLILLTNFSTNYEWKYTNRVRYSLASSSYSPIFVWICIYIFTPYYPHGHGTVSQIISFCIQKNIGLSSLYYYSSFVAYPQTHCCLKLSNAFQKPRI
jgi:hypothetical protein